MIQQPLLCDQCHETETPNLAEYFLLSEEVTLEGPALGDPDYWPAGTSRPSALCHEHYLQLPADARLDYRPLCDEFSPIL